MRAGEARDTEIGVQSLGQEAPLEEDLVTHSSILAWEIPWTQKPGGLQSIGLQRVGHDLTTKQQQQSPCTYIWLYLIISEKNCLHTNVNTKRI